MTGSEQNSGPNAPGTGRETGLRVVTGTLAELDALAALFDAYRQFYGHPADLDGARAYLEARMRGDESVVLLAVNAGLPVGFSQLYPSFCSLDLSRIFVLYDLFVDPSARRLGVARALLSAAEQHGRAAGASRLELSTAWSNTGAQALYEADGWMPDSTYRHYELPLIPPAVSAE